MAHDAWGVADGYEDAFGDWHATSPATRAAVLAAMDGDAGTAGPPDAAVRVIRPGEPLGLRAPADLRLEDGRVVRVEDALPADVPLGYHDLLPLDGTAPTRLIVTPGRCHLPAGLRTWGWAVQLYAARSRESWGIGDLADLRRLGRWSASTLGAGLLLVNPLLAVAPATPQEPSPYFPSSRRFLNPLYLRVEEVPGAAADGAGLDRLAAAGRALNVERRIDRDAVFRLKMEALQRLSRGRAPEPDFERYRAEAGPSLARFATFCALVERYGPGWERWPAEYRRPEAAAVTRFGDERAERVRFHEWLQWLLDRQLARAARELPLLHDLPIGVDPGGFDAWEWQGVLATGATVGAPPDRYVIRGQDWGLPPFVPHRLRATRYEPFVETVRATLRHAGGLRVDHVMGLFRLFWIPRGLTPAQGAFVRYPADDLVGILALESQRARALVVGEDLGTVEAGVRERLAAAAVLSYRILWFEAEPPSAYPRLALSAVSTHDLPTVAGLWTGQDVLDQRGAGLEPNVEAYAAIRRRLMDLTGLREDAAAEEMIVRVYETLARAPSVVVAATLEDAAGILERPNMPSTTDRWPNWSLALPAPIEDIEQSRLARAVALALAVRKADPSCNP